MDEAKIVYTEDEAKTKWCQEKQPAVIVTKKPLTDETINERLKAYKCTASECMAWRWVDNQSNGRRAFGYCGKAGKPY